MMPANPTVARKPPISTVGRVGNVPVCDEDPAVSGVVGSPSPVVNSTTVSPACAGVNEKPGTEIAVGPSSEKSRCSAASYLVDPSSRNDGAAERRVALNDRLEPVPVET